MTAKKPPIPGLDDLIDIGAGLRAGVVTITPALAAAWLNHFNYADNRNISQARTSLYSRRIAAGGWRLNAEAIIFDKESGLLNGQHRLKAVCDTNKAITCLVVVGVATETFTTMDQGYTRSGAQVFSMAGYARGSVRASVCRAVYSWETSNGNMTAAPQRIAPDELLLVQETYSDQIDEAVLYADGVRKDVPMSSGLLGLAHFVLTTARPRKAAEFLQVLHDGFTGVKGHPARCLRDRLIRDKLHDRMMPPDGQWWSLVRCWNIYDKGETMKHVAIKRDSNGNWTRVNIRGIKAMPAAAVKTAKQSA